MAVFKNLNGNSKFCRHILFFWLFHDLRKKLTSVNSDQVEGKHSFHQITSDGTSIMWTVCHCLRCFCYHLLSLFQNIRHKETSYIQTFSFWICSKFSTDLSFPKIYITLCHLHIEAWPQWISKATCFMVHPPRRFQPILLYCKSTYMLSSLWSFPFRYSLKFHFQWSLFLLI